MKCGGSTKKKMATGGSIAAGIPYATGAGATDGKNGMMRKGGAVKKMQDGGKAKTVIIKAKSTDPYPMAIKGNQMKLDGLALKSKGQMMKAKGQLMKAKGKTMSKMEIGGSVKNAKLAALAAPKNKITRADIIVGAKRNARKK